MKPLVCHAGAVLKILKQALASWDATESDLADAASIFMVPPPEAFQSACSAAQAVVNALIRMVQAERPQPGQDPALSHENSALAGGFRAQALAFVADFVTAGRATAQLQDTMPILECLAEHGEVCFWRELHTSDSFRLDGHRSGCTAVDEGYSGRILVILLLWENDKDIH